MDWFECNKKKIVKEISVDEAKELARNLNAGALPVPISLVSQQSVGPILGKVSLEQSLKAGILGLLAVMAFMTFAYRLPGFLASIALVIYAILNLALFKTIPVTLTLAGLGGFIFFKGNGKALALPQFFPHSGKNQDIAVNRHSYG